MNQVEVLDMMDMDEFLFENGLQGTSSGNQGAHTTNEASPVTSPRQQLANIDAECSSSASSSSSGTGSQLGFVKPGHLQFVESAVQRSVSSSSAFHRVLLTTIFVFHSMQPRGAEWRQRWWLQRFVRGIRPSIIGETARQAARGWWQQARKARSSNGHLGGLVH